MQYYYIVKKRQEIKVVQKVIYDPPIPTIDPGGNPHRDDQGISVTPFDIPVIEERRTDPDRAVYREMEG